jgi:hypothetical protein
LVKDWPYAVNLLASTRVAESGDPVDEALVAPAGSRIRLVPRVDMMLGFSPACADGSLVSLSGAAESNVEQIVLFR